MTDLEPGKLLRTYLCGRPIIDDETGAMWVCNFERPCPLHEDAEPPLVAGGQGRTAADVEADGWGAVCWMLAGFVIVVSFVICRVLGVL